jgi:uncharacterized protein (TIGR02246 family)
VKRWARVLIASSLVSMAVSCGPQNKAPERKVDVDAELRQATQHYADLVQKMDNAAVAALFTDDGQLVTGGQKPIQGPQAIQAFLDTFKQYHVQSETLTVQEVRGNSQTAHVLGRYDQKVQLPAGNVVEVQGSFAADWVRGHDDIWRMRRLAAFPEKQDNAGGTS